ncbi:uncharacterized protein GLRG_11685 [Colletotrichum graminicola M1.001]|uniref:Uncharacterized protein n=1 Tax=Colletotrichum graminicola (strain M1.001 / M2 / FGSC 10212) TaxID=645133 RepID=E3R088_COLGM|nr:uncharacterized protein GLRG_11685 [Colletotrichum graminicola M1.001]EFQ36526.1 hypothetical protein GLRG_11685 [Colletotrichum graminicola M1.001]
MALVSGHHVTTSTDFPVPTFATPLHAAALIGQDHMIRWILERCPTLPVDSEYGLYTLHYATFVLMPDMATDGRSLVFDADLGEGDVGVLVDRTKEATRLVSSLMGIGAIIDTLNEREAAKRLRQERNRLAAENPAANSA